MVPAADGAPAVLSRCPLQPAGGAPLPAPWRHLPEPARAHMLSLWPDLSHVAEASGNCPHSRGTWTQIQLGPSVRMDQGEGGS